MLAESRHDMNTGRSVGNGSVGLIRTLASSPATTASLRYLLSN